MLPIRTFQRPLAVARIIGYIRQEMEAAKMSAKVVSEVKVTFDKIIKLKVTRPREVKEKPLVNDELEMKDTPEVRVVKSWH